MNTPYVFKRCTKCKRILIANNTNFYKKAGRKWGLSSQCKQCENIRKKKYREEHLEESLERSRKYYEQNKDKVSERIKKYREENKEKIIERNRTYYKQNKDKIQKRHKEYYINNKKDILNKNKCWYENNKEHHAEWNKEYYKNNKDKIMEYHKQWYEVNKEYILEQSRKRYIELGIEEIKKRRRATYEKNKEKVLEYSKEYREKNSDKYKKWHKEYYENNKDKIAEYRKQYYKTPQGQITLINGRVKRRLKEKNQGNGITPEQWLECMKYFNWECAYSGETLKDNTRSIDHIKPLNQGGEHEIWNVVPMDRGLNSSKNDKDLLEWYKSQDFFSEERLQKIYDWQEYAFNKWHNKEDII